MEIQIYSKIQIYSDLTLESSKLWMIDSIDSLHTMVNVILKKR